MDNVMKPDKAARNRMEDIPALLAGTLMISFAIVLLRQSGALTGGTAGLAFLIHYATHISFGPVFFVINLPFYWLSIRRMGMSFTLKTFCAVALVAVFSDFHGRFIHTGHLSPFYAMLTGNIIMGTGLIILFRHRASVGGVNILALYLQDRSGFSAGKFQMAADVSIMAASLFVVSLPVMVASVAGAIILNLIIVVGHRPQAGIPAAGARGGAS
ncbi:hypothetical protein CYD30_25185 [Kosakonia cowanii]|nr:hypothetical protein CYD30_25185 [Kosakonia cowanii]